MAEEQKKQAAEAENAENTQKNGVENAEQKEEEKQEGKISGFFKKLGKKLDDATYATRMHSAYNDSHPKYVVYSGTGLLDSTPQLAVEEHLGEGYIVTIDESEKIAAGNLIKAPNGDVMHIASVEKAAVTFDFEGKSNELAATKIVLGEKAEQVKVIKVDDKFYLA